ncbi:hypothetical protein ma158 [Moumouvirus australiensis]|uniref:Uncharacterized protein n=1 Tax=Moumouvirus australiensis TaxID=2109587 RepID=A0A2P1EL05_9VIRU|nr:hypothetical protein QKC55_gp746 [Moumouvirus australiensis]AVL94544.1 hypothetical protein ma158 [Moumouvirus australiensis]
MKLLRFKKNNHNYEQIIWKYISKYKNNDERIIAEDLLDEIKSLEIDNIISVIITTLFYEVSQDIIYTQMIKEDFEKGLLMLIKLDLSTNLEQKEIISLKIRELENKIQYLNIRKNILKDLIRFVKN